MNAQLDTLLAKNTTLSSGHLRLLSLDRISGEMGAKWQSQGDQIRFITESIIRRHLRRGQTFYQANDSSYVIVFDFGEDERAEHVCRAISREILQRLLGSNESRNEESVIEMRVTQVSTDRLKRSENRNATIEGELDRAPAWRLSLPKEYGAPLVATPVGEVLEPETRSGLNNDEAQLLQRLRDRLISVESALASGTYAPSASSAPSTEAVEQIEFRYLPFWDPKTSAFLSCRINPCLSLAEKAAVETGFPIDIADDGQLGRAVDRLTIAQAMVDLTRFAREGRKYSVIVPIHAASVTTGRDRTHLIVLLEQISGSFPHLVNIELVDFSKLSWSDLIPCIWSFRGKCRRFILRQDFRKPTWLQTQHLPEDMVAISTVLPGASMSESQIGANLNAFVSAFAKSRCETYVYGVRTRSLAFAAIGAGADHVAGAAIAPAAPDPITAMRADLSHVFMVE